MSQPDQAPDPEEPNLDPLAQDDALTLEAELRQALQHQRAAYQQAEETREEMRRLMERARDLLRRSRTSPTSTGGVAAESDDETEPVS